MCFTIEGRLQCLIRRETKMHWLYYCVLVWIFKTLAHLIIRVTIHGNKARLREWCFSTIELFQTKYRCAWVQVPNACMLSEDRKGQSVLLFLVEENHRSAPKTFGRLWSIWQRLSKPERGLIMHEIKWLRLPITQDCQRLTRKGKLWTVY